MASRKKERRLVLSPTRIRSWLECSLQYRFTYVDRVSRFYYRPSPYDTFGAVMHRTLQAFHSGGGAAAVGPEDLQRLLESNWVSAGFESAAQERQFRETGRQMLQGYHRTAGAGKSRVLFLEKQFRRDYGSFVLTGRVDRLDEHPDGMLEIIDYKSSSRDVTPDDVRDSLALGCYTLLVRHHFPERRVRATLYALISGSRATVEFLPEELAVLEEDIHRVARRIEAEESYPPSFGPHCRGCIYNRICYRGGEVDWEERARQWEYGPD